MKSNYYYLKYDRKQSRADKSYAGSNYASHKKHHGSCHLIPFIGNRRYTVKMKKEGKGVANYVSQANSKLELEHPSSTKWIFHEPTVQNLSNVPKQKVSPILPELTWHTPSRALPYMSIVYQTCLPLTLMMF